MRWGRCAGTGQDSALLRSRHPPGPGRSAPALSARHLVLLYKRRLSFSLKQGIVMGYPLEHLWNKNCLCHVHWTWFLPILCLPYTEKINSHWLPMKEDTNVKQRRLEISRIFSQKKIWDWNPLTFSSSCPGQSNQNDKMSDLSFSANIFQSPF